MIDERVGSPAPVRGTRTTVFLGLGSNLGDARSNLLDAISQLRQRMRIEKLSSLYETEPAYVDDQPRFLNMVLEASIGAEEVSPEGLLTFLKSIERRMGRARGPRFGPRPIDLDILVFGDLRVESEALTVPHPAIAERAFVLVPLAEIAPHLVIPGLHETAAALAARPGALGRIVRVDGRLGWHLDRDLQAEPPQARLSLTGAGVSGLRRIVRLGSPRGPELFDAVMDVHVELAPDQKGVHMSRFSETVEEVLTRACADGAPTMEELAERIAVQVLGDQRTLRSDVHLRAHFPLQRHAPVSGQATQEQYLLIGMAAATHDRSVRLVGVEAGGMMACPCSQEMIASYARERLLDEGFSAAQAERALAVVPLATHNQRGRGTLLVGTADSVDARALVSIVEGAMSSETYGLLKRPDELFVVAKAHRHPLFVEDAVREMLLGALEIHPRLPDDAFLLARQVNEETIHRYDVHAERSGLVSELQSEVTSDAYVRPHTTLDAWLRSRLDPGG